MYQNLIFGLFTRPSIVHCQGQHGGYAEYLRNCGEPVQYVLTGIIMQPLI